MSMTSKCKGCGKVILWGVTADNKRIPLDRSAPVYRMVSTLFDGVDIERDKHAYVSHFATCPNANDFSKINKAK